MKSTLLETHINRYHSLKGRCKSIELMHPLPIPAFAAITNIAKSGEWPVKPKIVVLRYLWCPARSIKVISLDDCSQMSSAVRDSL